MACVCQEREEANWRDRLWGSREETRALQKNCHTSGTSLGAFDSFSHISIRNSQEKIVQLKLN